MTTVISAAIDEKNTIWVAWYLVTKSLDTVSWQTNKKYPIKASAKSL